MGRKAFEFIYYLFVSHCFLFFANKTKLDLFIHVSGLEIATVSESGLIHRGIGFC